VFPRPVQRPSVRSLVLQDDKGRLSGSRRSQATKGCRAGLRRGLGTSTVATLSQGYLLTKILSTVSSEPC